MITEAETGVTQSQAKNAAVIRTQNRQGKDSPLKPQKPWPS